MVRSAAQPSKYNSAEDWLPVRTGIQKYLRGGAHGPELDEVIARANDARRARYEQLVSGFRRYRGRRAIQWFEPPALAFTHGALTVQCKPDLGIRDGNGRYLLKLHYGTTPPSNERVSVVAQVIRSAMRGAVASDMRFGILDLRRGRLRARAGNQAMADAIEEEAETFLSYWKRYEGESGRDVA